MFIFICLNRASLCHLLSQSNELGNPDTLTFIDSGTDGVIGAGTGIEARGSLRQQEGGKIGARGSFTFA